MNEPESTQAKIARLEAEREARAAARAEAEKDRLLPLQAAALDALEGLEAKHPGGVRMVQTVCGPVIVRGPTQKQYRDFRAALHKPDTRADAMRVMVTACVLHPSFDDFDASVRAKPGIVDIIADAVCELGGVVTDPKS